MSASKHSYQFAGRTLLAWCGYAVLAGLLIGVLAYTFQLGHSAGKRNALGGTAESRR